jgi:2-dehydropantoate 2-reductase
MRVAVIGAGGVGGYYAARLHAAGHEVAVLARGAHLRAMQERGLLVWSPLGDVLARVVATDDPQAVGVVDLVLFAVKTYDTDSALPLVPPLIGPGSTVLTLQNGIRSAETLASAVGGERVLGGATYIATAIALPGLIEQTGTHRRIVFGEVRGDLSHVSPRVATLADALAKADIETEPAADGRVAIWEKFIYLAPFAAVTAASRQPAGVVWNDPDLRALFVQAMGEAERLARAEGVAVRPDIADCVAGYMDAVPPTMRSSLLIDLERGRRLEIDALAGDIVTRSRDRGLPTPAMSTLYAVLKPLAGGAAARNAL